MILLIGFLIISVVNIASIVKFIMAIRFKNKDIERAICSPLDNRDDGPPPETVFLIRNKFLALSYKQASIYVSVWNLPEGTQLVRFAWNEATKNNTQLKSSVVFFAVATTLPNNGTMELIA